LSNIDRYHIVLARRQKPEKRQRCKAFMQSVNIWGIVLDIAKEVVKVLDEILRLGDRAVGMGRETALLGAIPELDSMAVVSILTLIEERFGIVVEDDEMDGAVFATVGTLTDFVGAKLEG
jgi:acyl carrier protein